MKDFAKILAFAKPYKKIIAFAFFCLTLTSAINLLLPLIVKNMINAVLVLKDSEVLNTLTFQLGAIILLQAAFSVTHNYIFGFVGQRITADFRIKFFSHLQTLSLRFFQSRRVGEILSRMSGDITTIENALVAIPVAVLRQTITLFGALIIILYLNWKLTGLILLVLPPLMIGARIFGRRLRGLAAGVQDQMAKASVVLEETMSSIKVVKSYGREPYENQRFQKEINDGFDISLGKLKISASFGPIILCMTFLLSALLIWYGGTQVMQGATTPGELAAFFLYALVIAGPIGTFVRIYTQSQEALGAVRRVYEIFDSETEVRNCENPITPAVVHGGLQFENVQFGYDKDAPILKGVDFDIKPGQNVALVGPSGAGKTTIVQLLLRFFDPDSGAVKLDGTDIKQIDLKFFLDQFALVPQETHLFGGTIRENILYGKLDATEEELIHAAKQANAHDFIMNLEDGYDHLVGEKGVKLSGGERQRISIARAFLKNPKILVLDEATSSLDNQSEALIKEALETLTAGRTTVVIAHRLSAVHHADKIVVIDKGHVVEVGNHQSLMANENLYYHLYATKQLEADIAE
ncbi:MAG: ABC transporter ATP-binding protein [Candidatus Nitrohelix vancouverensis]|uniref:ABC transporter ATP-binding protein n=1 Tax=Candidatus Nitrohelix vancouverensis TaxID=2705534 RepID=A0A7T0G2Y7_9BACT|nr:MAG: ABC transporter ATP-binding protein [Candidatus Nitrohelix vancouverensis]